MSYILDRTALTVAPLFFPLHIVLSSEVVAEFEETRVRDAIEKHLGGDWGEWPTEGEAAHREGLVLDCYYLTPDGYYLQVVTSADRSLTVVMTGDPYQDESDWNAPSQVL